MAKPTATTTRGPAPTYTVAQVAEALQKSRRHCYAMINSGEWPHRRIGPQSIRISQADYEYILGKELRGPTA